MSQHTSEATIRRALAVAAFLAAPVLAGAPPADADIPGDPTPACRGETRDGAGSITTPTEGSIILAGDYLTQYQAGHPVTMYNNQGSRSFTDAGTAADSTRVPACAVRSVGGVPVATWLYCTDETLGACNDRPTLAEEQPNPRLSASDHRQIAMILANAHAGSLELTTRGRAIVQLQVWCISEGVPAGSVMTAAQTYYNSNNRLPPGDDLTSTEAICDPRPTVPPDPSVTVSATSATTTAGAPATYRVMSTEVGPVHLSSSSGALTLCPDDASGAAFDGVRLDVAAAGVPVRVCASTPTHGTQTLSARIDFPSLNGFWAWTGDVSCQHFAGYPDHFVSSTSTASVSVAPAPTVATTTSIAPSSTGSTTTTAQPMAGNRSDLRGSGSGAPGALAATGGRSPRGLASIGVGVIAIGVGVLTGRRRSETTPRS